MDKIQSLRKIIIIKNKEIEIHFEFNDSLIILIIKETLNSHNISEYKEQFSFENLKNINNYFNFFDNIKEIYDDIANHLEKQEYKYIKENNKITLFIKIKISTKEIEIPLSCSKNANNVIVNNDQINEKVEYNINFNIGERINQLENDINNISKSQISTENNISKIFELLNNYIPNINIDLNSEKNNFFNIPSLICHQSNEVNFLKNLLPNKKLTLLYRATKDGDSFDTFHSKCDNQGETVTLCETNKGRKFGGHMNQSISTNEEWFNKLDTNFFLFSLNKLKCYRPTSEY